MEKTCSKCKKTKSEDEFNWKNKSKGTRQSACKECTRVQVKAHFEANTKYYRDKARRINDKLRKSNQREMLAYLKEHPCVDCGEDDARCLTFDHVRGKKISAVSVILRQCKWERVLDEINKCEVRCANCHMKKTADDFGFYTAAPVA